MGAWHERSRHRASGQAASLPPPAPATTVGRSVGAARTAASSRPSSSSSSATRCASLEAVSTPGPRRRPRPRRRVEASRIILSHATSWTTHRRCRRGAGRYMGGGGAGRGPHPLGAQPRARPDRACAWRCHTPAPHRRLQPQPASQPLLLQAGAPLPPKSRGPLATTGGSRGGDRDDTHTERERLPCPPPPHTHTHRHALSFFHLLLQPQQPRLQHGALSRLRRWHLCGR